jgi:hypothetical protein
VKTSIKYASVRNGSQGFACERFGLGDSGQRRENLADISPTVGLHGTSTAKTSHRRRSSRAHLKNLR